MTRPLLVAVCLLLPLAVSCRKKRSFSEETAGATPPSAGVTRCGAGIQRAIETPDLAGSLKTYFTECADLYSKPVCKDAWIAAATAPRAQQMNLVADACRKAYCPDLEAETLELCRADVAITGETIDRAWGAFSAAVVEREAGEYAPQLLASLLGFYVHTKQLEMKEVAIALASSGSAGTAPPPSGAPVPSAAPASAAPSAGPGTGKTVGAKP